MSATTATTRQIRHTDIRRTRHEGQDVKVRGTYGIDVTNRAYFFLVGDIWNKYASTNTDPMISGAISNEVVRVFPKLADIAALHLSDAITGEPMHAEANGWYFLQNGGAEAAAKHLRAAPERLKGITTREQFAALVEELRPEWQAEAEAVRDRYGLTI